MYVEVPVYIEVPAMGTHLPEGHLIPRAGKSESHLTFDLSSV